MYDDAPQALEMEELPAPTEEELADPIWRLNNIYSIRTPTGEPMPFRPKPEQQQVIEAIFIHGWEHLIIPKARQLGMSTIIALIVLDTMLFGESMQATIIDKTATDAQRKLEEKIVFAFQKLPIEFRQGWEVVTDNEGEWRIRLVEEESTTESFVYAGDKGRGGTNQILWISEWGHINHERPEDSKEILTGALPTAEHPGCYVINETTWKGGKSGDIWPSIVLSRQIPEAEKGPKDPRVMFFPWDTNPENRDYGHPSLITAETHEYFDTKERTTRAGTVFDSAQRLWYQKTAQKIGILMQREYPTDEEECFTAPDEGTFFDPGGIGWQETCNVPLQSQIKYGNIVLVGDGEIAQFRPCPRMNATYAILEEPIDGESYIIPGDFSGQPMKSGEERPRDKNANCVIRASRINPDTRVSRKAQVVACLLPGNEAGTTPTIHLMKGLHRLYGNCMTVPETNNKDNICEQMRGIGIDVIWRETIGAGNAKPGTSKRIEVDGWFTDEGRRRQMLEWLRDSLRQEAFITTFPWIVDELKTFIINSKGRAEAASGCNDDFVMMLGIGIFCLNSATLYKPEMHTAWRKGKNRTVPAPTMHPWDP